MGDRLALQYGGSEAHKKVSKGAGKTKHGEFLTSIKRYYSNSFTDRVKQDAMNLFLGYFQPAMHDFNLWDLETDYFLHNRLLHPPRPDVDSILLAYKTPPLALCDDPTASPSSEADKDKPSTRNSQDITNKGSHGGRNSTIDLSGFDWPTIFKRFFHRSSSLSEEELQLIAGKEVAKLRLGELKVIVKDAEELWWRQALMDFESERMWMCLPPLKENASSPYFDTAHNAFKLTSFDHELSLEFQYPFDATIFASPKPKSSGYWNRRRKDGDQKASHEDEDEDDADIERVDSAESDKVAIEPDQETFDLFSFARNIGEKARTIVGDLLKPTDSDSSMMKVPSQEYLGVQYRPRWQNSPKTSYKMALNNQTPCKQYLKYILDSERPEDYIKDSYSESTHDFVKALANFNVNGDDVKEMEKLANESHLSDRIASGKDLNSFDPFDISRYDSHFILSCIIM
jgi:hypothetical protein